CTCSLNVGGNYRKSAALFKGIIQRKSIYSPDALLGRAKSYIELGQMGKAKADLQEYIRLSEKGPQTDDARDLLKRL
ncbi:MAG: tetratricopeptide repeat protein, partial [Thermodesulfovibrionales bacterium]|nr:tetratricopeptide repeat protein [Thermodesulfovibrionales bacterium]